MGFSACNSTAQQCWKVTHLMASVTQYLCGISSSSIHSDIQTWNAQQMHTTYNTRHDFYIFMTYLTAQLCSRCPVSIFAFLIWSVLKGMGLTRRDGSKRHIWVALWKLKDIVVVTHFLLHTIRASCSLALLKKKLLYMQYKNTYSNACKVI